MVAHRVRANTELSRNLLVCLSLDNQRCHLKFSRRKISPLLWPPSPGGAPEFQDWAVASPLSRSHPMLFAFPTSVSLGREIVTLGLVLRLLKIHARGSPEVGSRRFARDSSMRIARCSPTSIWLPPLSSFLDFLLSVEANQEQGGDRSCERRERGRLRPMANSSSSSCAFLPRSFS